MLQDHRTITTIQMDNDQFLPQVVNLLQEGHTVTLPLRGRSMRPFLEDGRDKALLKIAKHYAVGDAVLAEIAKGSFVLHRIIVIDGDDVTLRGDGNLNNEYCKIIDIRAKAIGFYRKGRNKLDSTDGCKWRIYSWWWTRLYSIRRYLLFAMHPHIPRRWRRQTS
ncbi:S24/S26 family peptidase [Xylanibacter brevis]|uniref:S24/S26 family peptidase n=1 Tax=Xylanibacter brevis TaxID=83231 RepID=UPI0005C79279|nr:S24/S26 family peptidase [Xylanibacter brevis]